ncbi:MAG: DNA replication/repair protein RecF [Nitritalea sp.]
MYLAQLQLHFFKNYERSALKFVEGINCFVGPNGSGKTNLLDAIHYLCLTKSGFGFTDSQSIAHQSQFFTLQAEVEGSETFSALKCIQEQGKRKLFYQDGRLLERLSEHVGALPVVLIAPDDADMVKGPEENRRKFFDNTLCQLDSTYLKRLSRYQHLLKQRNALLKTMHAKGRFQADFLAPYDSQLLPEALWIAQQRQLFLADFEPLLQAQYQAITAGQEQLQLQYESQALDPAHFEKAFHEAAYQDYLAKRSTVGVHKDAFHLQLDGHPIRKFGSQGQVKSAAIALKLAQFLALKARLGFPPILLLDDIFDKLDDKRIEFLLRLVAQNEFGQLFLTDARPERSKKMLASLQTSIRVFPVSGGQVLEPEDIGQASPSV